MNNVGAYEAKTHLPRLLDRVARGESLTITRHGRPVARLIPADSPRDQAKQAVLRIECRRRNLTGVSVTDLIASVHEGHRW